MAAFRPGTPNKRVTCKHNSPVSVFTKDGIEVPGKYQKAPHLSPRSLPRNSTNAGLAAYTSLSPTAGGMSATSLLKSSFPHVSL